MLSIIPKISFVGLLAIISVEMVVTRYVATIQAVHGIRCSRTNGLMGITASFLAIYVLMNIHKISSIIIQ